MSSDRAVRFSLPFPVSVNSVWRAWQGRIVMCPKAREYRDKVIREVERLRVPSFGAERLAVHYVLIEPNAKARDLANFDKVLSDALTKAKIWNDDSQIDDHRFTRGASDPTNPRVEVFISKIAHALA